MKEQDIKWVHNEGSRKSIDSKFSTEFVAQEEIRRVRNFHRSFQQYEVTPLWNLKNLAKELGISNVFVKDESYRFGLNAFKVLGGSYSIGKYLSKRLNMDIKDVSFDKLKSREIKEKLGEITFVTATDGNHGRGVAWAANQLGHKSVVFMPKGSSEIRLENIKKEGAEAYITDYNYDDAVRLANKHAEEHNAVIVQDTAWEGYEEIPLWIMQGYATIAEEVMEQLNNMKARKPTHVFLQAGVGSFAASILGYFVSILGNDRPITAIIEPEKAACIYKSAKINDGNPHSVTGDMNTIMAGLACGEPNTVGWNILRDYAEMYFSCPDYVSARGIRILACPLKYDPKVISGESGSVGIGLISILLQNQEYKEAVDQLKLDENSRVLIINTEGDTDPADYRRIVWDGHYPSKGGNCKNES